MYKILIIEDDKDLNNMLKKSLEKENYEIVQAFNGKEAFEYLYNEVNLIVLDLMLPDTDGLEILRKVREKSAVPVIILFDKNDEKIKLTQKEFEALKLFIKNPTRVYTKQKLYSLVWNEEYFESENTVTVLIKRLRQKIEDDSKSPKYIETVWGIGYKLGDE